jgi:BirA family biotin operon repressor/biotin-[acetyl-CoA-carboxylase] ligase
MLTLVAASAVAEGIDKVTGQCCQIKWPNDIVLNKKKVCGILTEMNMEIDSIAYVVVGIGINVNRINFGEEIADMATSLKKESGHNIERSVLLSEILTAFFRDYKLFLEKQDLSPFLESYNQKLVNVGREVKIIKKGEEIIRTAIGINDRGELIVQDAEGNTEHIFSGEVSVRGIYGYV